MKILTKNLLPAVKSLISIAGGRTTLPILNCFLIEAKNNTLTISASDIDQFCEWIVPCDGPLDACCVSASRFLALVQASPEEIEIVKDLLNLKITGTGETVLPLLGPEEFVSKPSGNAKAVAVNCAELADSVSTVEWSAHRADNSRFPLEHVFMLLSAKGLQVFATNGRALSRVVKNLICGDCIISLHQNRIANFCEWLISNGATLIKCDKYVSVKSERGQWFGMLPSGFNPPNIGSIIEGVKTKLGSISREEILSCAPLARSLGGQANSHPAKLLFSKTGLQLKTEQFSRTIVGKFSPLETKFDLDLLVPMLNKLDADTLALKTDGELIVQWSDGKADVFLCMMKGGN